MDIELDFSTEKSKRFLDAKPSDLLDIALEDLQLVQEDNEYELRMEFWHEYNHKNDKCFVCLAGAVLSFSLSCNREVNVELCDFTPKVKDRLTAINSLRIGDVEEAFRLLRLNQDEGAKFNRRVSSYRDLPEEAVAEWQKLASDLKRTHF